MRRRAVNPFAVLLLVASSLAGPPPATLRVASAGRFPIGAAVTSAQTTDPRTSALILSQFAVVTPEFELMPQFVHPEPDRFTFERSDKVVDFAVRHGLPVDGHMLLWHQFTPAWMFQDAAGRPLPREQALSNLKRHINGVVAHYRGRIRSWNVVNEAVSDNGDEYLRDTPALRAIGPDYVVRAFEFAHAADPAAELCYNDYNVEVPRKLPKVLRLIGELKAAGVRLNAVGIQGHWLIDFPATDVIDRGITAVAAAGVGVRITELDVDPLPRAPGADLNAKRVSGDDPYRGGLPPDVGRRLADRYADIFRVLTRHVNDVQRVTFWGVDDKQSWLNDYPIGGRINHPLLFDRDLRPKAAYDAVVGVLQKR